MSTSARTFPSSMLRPGEGSSKTNEKPAYGDRGREGGRGREGDGDGNGDGDGDGDGNGNGDRDGDGDVDGMGSETVLFWCRLG